MSTQEGPRTPDPYEAEYMSGEPVLYRDKIQASRSFHVVIFFAFLIPLLNFAFLLYAGASTGEPIPGVAFIAPVFVTLFVPLLWILFSVLRVTVTAKTVHVQYGLFGPRIPLDKIERCEAVAYDWKKYGGWGIRRAVDGSKAYNIMGDAGRAAKIVWRDEKGKEQVTLVASPYPERLSRAINEARAVAAGGDKERARVGAPARARLRPMPDAQALAEAEAELEAELARGDQATGGREQRTAGEG